LEKATLTNDNSKKRKRVITNGQSLGSIKKKVLEKRRYYRCFGRMSKCLNLPTIGKMGVGGGVWVFVGGGGRGGGKFCGGGGGFLCVWGFVGVVFVGLWCLFVGGGCGGGCFFLSLVLILCFVCFWGGGGEKLPSLWNKFFRNVRQLRSPKHLQGKRDLQVLGIMIKGR